MRAARLAAAALAAAALASPAAAGATGWRTVHAAGGDVEVSLPVGWQVVPVSTAAVVARAARLRKGRQLALAAEYEEVAAARKHEPPFLFQAFRWPAKGPIVTDVSVKVDALAPATTAADLPTIAADYRKALARPKGAAVGPVAKVRLAAGPAVRLSGTIDLGKVRSAYVVYLLLRPKRLYSLSFRTAATHAAGDAGLFRAIAERLRLR